ncbi:MAG: VCBS repeat-containing protein [Candidatus Woesearchaeota archaeon]|nr:MAG: VCBS repeat-containing protein [Candidatus Woesearchaeota archaeon]
MNQITVNKWMSIVVLLCFLNMPFAMSIEQQSATEKPKLNQLVPKDLEIHDLTRTEEFLSSLQKETATFAEVRRSRDAAQTISSLTSVQAQIPVINPKPSQGLMTSGIFQTNLISGAATYSYPIIVPQGIGVATPQISLAYNHQLAQAVQGIAGAGGWGLGIPVISRNVEHTLADTTDDTFSISMQGIAGKLVFDGENFHTEQESFALIQKLQTENNENGEYWVVKSKDGTTYRFGFTTAAEKVSNLESYSTEWYLDQVTDVFGNTIIYSYTENPHEQDLAATYLEEITYGNTRIEFVYEETNNPAMYLEGNKVRFGGRISEIVVLYSEQVVRSYQLSYAPVGPFKEFIHEISVVGADGSSSLPPTTFTYQEPHIAWEESTSYTVPSEAMFGSTDDSGTRILDVNEDGLQDLIAMQDSSTLKIWLNNGNGWDEKQEQLNVFSGGFVDGEKRDRGVRFLDMNGDSRIDLLHLSSGDVQEHDLILNTQYGWEQIEAPLPDSISFVELIDEITCEPELCRDGWTETYEGCEFGVCYRNCTKSYAVCDMNWNLVFTDTDGYDSSRSEKNAETAQFDEYDLSKCYKFEVEPPTESARINVDEDECFTNYPDDGDTQFSAGLVGDDDNSWLETVPPIDGMRGWYDNFAGAVQEIYEEYHFDLIQEYDPEYEQFYLTALEQSPGDFDEHNDMEDFLEQTNSIICAPDELSCALQEYDNLCGYGCSNEPTAAYMQSGYYLDFGSAIETMLFDFRCQNENVITNRGEDLTLRVYEATTHAEDHTYQPYCSGTMAEAKDQGYRLADINNDGKTDLLLSTTSTQQVWLNNGDSFSQTNVWQLPLQATFIDENGRSQGTIIVDINGDNLPDLVKSFNEERTTWLNTGKEFVVAQEFSLPDEVAFVEGNASNGFRLVDVNSDALVDIIYGNTTQSVWLNTGHGWTQSMDIALPQGLELSKNGVQFVDVNGDNSADILVAGSHENRTSYVSSNGQANLLREISSSYGSTTEISYQLSSSLDNTGNDEFSDLPFSSWIVSAITNDNGVQDIHHVSSTTTYTFEGGFFDPHEQEFRGFSKVTEHFSDNSFVEHYYYQDDARKGLEYLSKFFDQEGNLLSENENIFATETQNGVTKVKLTQHTQRLYDGQLANPLVTRKNYLYDAYNNIVEEYSEGNIAVPNDEKRTVLSYSHNENEWILNKPHTVQYFDQDDVLVRENQFYYDDQPHETIPVLGKLTGKEVILTDDDSIMETFTYDAQGNVISYTNPRGFTTTYYYDPTDRFVIAEQNARNQTTNYEYDERTGNLLSSTSPQGITTTHEYDTFGRLIKTILPYDSVDSPTQEIIYDEDGVAPEATIIRTKVDEESEHVSTTYMDGFLNVIQSNEEGIVKDILYNEKNQVRKIVNPVLGEEGTYISFQPNLLPAHTTFEYDAFGIVKQTVFPNGMREQVNRFRQTEEVCDMNYHCVEREYDAHGRIALVREFIDNEAYETTYRYDVFDNLIEIIDSQGNTFSYIYDTAGRKIASTDPDVGTITYVYDANNNLVEQTDNAGISITFVYDELDRLIQKNSSSAEIHYIYDQNHIGLLSEVHTPDIIKYFSYDDRGRIIQEVKEIESETFVTLFEYDNQDRVIAKTLPNDEVIEYTYDERNNLASIVGVVDSITYDAAQFPTSVTLANGLQTTYTYDQQTLRLERIQTPGVQDILYVYDPAGNIIREEEPDMVKQYTYDSIDRLRTAQLLGSAVQINLTYAYDSLGNMLNYTQNNDTVEFIYGEETPIHSPVSIYTLSEEFPRQICYANEDCGIDGYSETLFCSNNSIANRYETFTCHNPGTEESYCEVEYELEPVEDCGAFNICLEGGCYYNPPAELIITQFWNGEESELLSFRNQTSVTTYIKIPEGSEVTHSRLRVEGRRSQE